MSTPERQQDPGEHGYGATKQEPSTDSETDAPREHPLESPDNDSGVPPDPDEDQ
jgi:hypothetical protein